MIGTGFLLGREGLTNFLFDPGRPYAGCCICGEVYQNAFNRQGSYEGLKEWRERHNKTHSERQHIQLIKSGRRFTPEAAQRLATLGIIDFGVLAMDPEYAHAYATAPRAPINDVEGSR